MIGFHSNEGVKEKYHPRRRYSTAIDSSSVKTVADTDLQRSTRPRDRKGARCPCLRTPSDFRSFRPH